MEERQPPKRQNTNATPPRNNSKETTIVSPPKLIKISSPDGKLPKESSDEDIDAHIAQLTTLGTVPPSAHQNNLSGRLALYLTYVRVGDGNMHIIWATQKDNHDHAMQLYPIQKLPFDKSPGAIELRKKMGCHCTWLNRRQPDYDTKVLFEYPGAHNGWKAMFSWNRTGASHEQFIQSTLDTLAGLLKNDKKIGFVEYKVVESELRDPNLSKNECHALDKYLTVYSVSQVINYTFYRCFLVSKYKKRESGYEYQLDSRIRMSFYNTHSDYVNYLFSRRPNGNYATEAQCWGYPAN